MGRRQQPVVEARTGWRAVLAPGEAGDADEFTKQHADGRRAAVLAARVVELGGEYLRHLGTESGPGGCRQQDERRTMERQGQAHVQALRGVSRFWRAMSTARLRRAASARATANPVARRR